MVLALLAIPVFSILLIVAQVLVVLDRGIPLRKRIGTGLAAFSAVLLCVLWTRVTTGRSALPAFLHRHKSYSVTLTWKTSKSLVNGYNVYRSRRFGVPTREWTELPGSGSKERDNLLLCYPRRGGERFGKRQLLRNYGKRFLSSAGAMEIKSYWAINEISRAV